MQRFMVSALVSAALSLTALGVSAQHNYVKDRPHEHAMNRPNRPDAHHVWVGTEWRWNNGRYEESQGHWDVAPHGRRTWVAGHWAKERRGSYWVPGHWS